MSSGSTSISLRSAALIAGISLLIMVVAAPYAEMYVYPKLVSPYSAGDTVQNIQANSTLFVTCILGYL